MPASPLAWGYLGRVGYRPAWALQEALRRALLDGGGDEGERLLLLEHDPVITLGRSARMENVLLPAEALAARGVELVRANRGGDVTYHGPGQLVAYPVVRIGPRGLVAHVEAMAQAVIDVAARHGVAAAFRRDCVGVWVGSRKLCAFGIHVHRRVAIHGLAFNLSPALDAFSTIVPCGLRQTGVTSIAELTGSAPSLPEAAAELAEALARHLERVGRPLSDGEIASLRALGEEQVRAQVHGA